jgi:hypothetical protein
MVFGSILGSCPDFYSGSIRYTGQSEVLIAGWVKKEDNFVGLGGRGFTGFGVKEYVILQKVRILNF